MTGTGMGFGEKNPGGRRENPGGRKLDQGTSLEGCLWFVLDE